MSEDRLQMIREARKGHRRAHGSRGGIRATREGRECEGVLAEVSSASSNAPNSPPRNRVAGNMGKFFVADQAHTLHVAEQQVAITQYSQTTKTEDGIMRLALKNV